jgi:putative PEP-CTERM system integral membrane protein
MKRLARFASYAVFWSWNAVFAAFVGFGVAPFMLPFMLEDVVRGWMPASYLVWTAGLILLPLGCIALGVTRRFRGEPYRLLALFYSVEAPLFVLALARLFAMREMNSGFAAVAAAVVVAAAVSLLDLLHPEPRAPGAVGLRLLGHGISSLVGLFLAAWTAFYAVPAAGAVLKELLSIDAWRSFGRAVVNSGGVAGLAALFGILLLLCSGTLFAALPVALPVLQLRALGRAVRWAKGRIGGPVSLAMAGAGAVALLVTFILAAHQPQGAAFALLEKKPTDDGERARLLGQSERIRDGLMNAYLASYRYAGAAATDRHIAQMYREALGVSEQEAQAVQDLYGLVGWPVRYDGASFHEDRQRAEALYERFFDQPIERAEREAILASASSTFDRGTREARLLDVGAERVLLARQELSVVEHGDWAQVELHEVYENQTFEQQEVLYYFNLPATAAVTGLWLGDSDDRSKRFEFTVAPRGAAQQVYREEVRRRQDPALLEQVGPRQYRLRIFPVPARPVGRDARGTAAPRMHLWMTYAVFAADGGWPLPRLSERRNVYWTGRTERILGGAEEPEGDGWLPPSVPARTKPVPARHVVTLPGGHLIAAPVQPESTRPRDGARLALVLDTSRSMERQAEAVERELAWAREALGATTTDLYITASQDSGRSVERAGSLASFDPQRVVYFGRLAWPEILQQLESARAGARYDAVLVLTDDGPYELAAEGTAPKTEPALWMVHAGGALPRAYDDGTLDQLSRPGSGVATTLGEALRRWSAADAMPKTLTDFQDGYLWSIEESGSAQPASAGAGASGEADPFAPLAARQLVLAMARWKQAGRPVTLDHIHAVAVKQRIVTPYSSMLVLVNDEQRRRLAELEKQEDRFDREVETGKGSPSQGSDLLNVSGVPEPHEWALIGVAAALLALRVLSRRQRAAALT